MSKWQPWENPTVADGLEIDVLRPILPSIPDTMRYIRVCEVYDDKGERTKAIEEVLEFCDQDGEGHIISANDTEFLWRNRSVAYAFSLLPLVDAEFLERLFELVKSESKPDRMYRLYTKGQQAAIVRELIVEPEVAAVEPRTAPDWNNCPVTGKPHDFASHKFRDNPIGESPRIISQYCRDCRVRLATEGI